MARARLPRGATIHRIALPVNVRGVMKIKGNFLKAAQLANGARYSAGDCATLDPIEAFHLIGAGYFAPIAEAPVTATAGAQADVDVNELPQPEPAPKKK